jgi:MFS family permease
LTDANPRRTVRGVSAAALSALVSAVFAIVMGTRYLRRRRAHQLAWTVGLAMFAAAAIAGALARTAGATETEYRVFYLFGAILNVAWLALGTLYLLAPRIARWAVWVVVGLTVVAAVAVFTSPVDLTAAVDTGKGFGESPLPRILAGIGSGIGSVILIGGALWSAFVFLRRRHEGRRALGNVIIAAGVLVAAAGGTAAFTGASGVVEWTNFVGVTLIFIGFLLV